MIRYILRSISVMNLLLAGLLALLLSYGIYPLFSANRGLTMISSKKTALPAEEKAPVSEALPVLTDYVVIAEKNLFHPARIIPVEKKEEKPLPKPDFVFVRHTYRQRREKGLHGRSQGAVLALREGVSVRGS